MRDEPEKSSPETGLSAVSATRHVGRTLESEGVLEDVSGTELPSNDSAPGSERPDGDSLEVHTFAEDRASQSAVNREDEAQAEGRLDPTPAPDADRASLLTRKTGEVPQALKTRLPGDTSSDPHTDMGPDNATTAHGTTER